MVARVALCLAICLAAGGAAAKPASCETSDDGGYPCDFELTDRNGSFRVTGRGKPTYSVEIDEPGVGQAFAELGGRNVSLPGPYRLKAGGCWVSDATDAKICAR